MSLVIVLPVSQTKISDFMMLNVGILYKVVINIFPGGEGISPASLAMHVGLGNQPPPLGSALHPSHYFSSFSEIGTGGE